MVEIDVAVRLFLYVGSCVCLLLYLCLRMSMYLCMYLSMYSYICLAMVLSPSTPRKTSCFGLSERSLYSSRAPFWCPPAYLCL